MSAVRVRWLGHSSFQITGAHHVIYVDLKKYGKVVEATEKGNFILVTHNHGDHCCPSLIEKLSTKDTVIVAPKNCAPRFKGNVRSLASSEEMTLDGLNIMAVEAYNVKRFRPSGKLWHPKGYGVGYLIQIDGKRIYHAGDTDLIPEMSRLKNLDLAILPTGDKYTMDDSEAAEAALIIKPKFVLPMHTWGIDRTKFKEAIEARSNINVILLQEGDVLELK